MKDALARGWVILFFALGTVSLAMAAAPDPALRRAKLQEAAGRGAGAVAVVAAGLKDENVVIRRTAARLLAGMGAAGAGTLAGAMKDGDFLVRRTALMGLCAARPGEAASWLAQGLSDPHPAVRRAAVDRLAAIEPKTGAVTELLRGAARNEDGAIRDVASAALFPFDRDNVSLRHRTDYDHDVKVASAIPLPVGGWKFRTDAAGEGHLSGWQEAACDGQGWSAIEIGRTWESQGRAYDGFAWYRLSFDLPARPAKMAAVDLAFDGVDEGAWVWLNGQYVGKHDRGKVGWNQPFQMDITREARWGGRNELVVRVFDSAAAGGIWKPVRVEVLE